MINQQLFFALLRAGLWSKGYINSDLNLDFNSIDWDEVYQLAEEQSVVGLLADGLDKLYDSGKLAVPLELKLNVIGEALQIEQQNKAMNEFVAQFIMKLRQNGINALLVKGQSIAQNYEKPLWRSCGDVDLLLDSENYDKAKKYLHTIADDEEPEAEYRKHKAYFISNWEVELHGNFRGQFLKSVDRVVDEIQKEVFDIREFRIWKCGDTDVHLPKVDDDIIFVFIHILQHYFVEGVGLRQVCDWSRLIYVYHSEINVNLLRERLQEMGMTTEWKAFGAFAVEWLGMPAGKMPLYSEDKKWIRKADRIKEFILETGNFGHKRETERTYSYPFIVRKINSFFRHTWDGYRYFQIFPLDAVKIWAEMIKTGTKSVLYRKIKRRF